MLFFLAGLQSIPASTREAAVMEGATATQVFFKVTLPLLRPTISFVITTALIYSITQIDHVAVMTRGGPDNATTVLLYYIQNLAPGHPRSWQSLRRDLPDAGRPVHLFAG